MTNDIYTEVNQSASDKVIKSATYPLTVLEKMEAFPGCTKLAAKMATEDGAPFYALTKSEINEYLTAAVADMTSSLKIDEVSVSSEIYAFGGEIIQQAQHVIDAGTRAKGKYDGPDLKGLQKIVDGGIEGLGDTLGDWGMYAWCPYLQVIVKKEPDISLASPRISLNGIEIKVSATGELWAKFPWWNCHKWCTKWQKVIKCKRIASISASPIIKAEAHAILRAEAAKIVAHGKFDKLRLKGKILDKIPLEGIANKALDRKLVYVFDARKFVATVPTLESKFSVDKVTLPKSTDSIGVGIEVKKI